MTCFQRFVSASVFFSLLAPLSLSALAQANLTALISQNSAGQQGNDVSFDPSVSADGRYVAFFSYAVNLVNGDSNGREDVFVRDRQTGITTRVSVASNGTAANHYSGSPSISADGRYVAFVSRASNLVSGDTNNVEDVFVHDRQTGQTTRVSVASNGDQGDAISQSPAISADGRYVAFESRAKTLVPGDSNNFRDVFIRDRQTGQTRLVSLSSQGLQGDNASFYSSISADGRFVCFISSASNLVPGDNNNAQDVFVHDVQTGQTQRVSLSSAGLEVTDAFFEAALSGNGRFVCFVSASSALLPGDTNNEYDVFVRDLQLNTLEMVSVTSTGTQGSAASSLPSISADGRFVAFHSDANDLVPDDTNFHRDVFVHDRQTGQTQRASVSSSGVEADGDSSTAAISANGQVVAFESYAANLVAGDANGVLDIFVRQIQSAAIPGDVDGNGCVDDFDLFAMTQDFLSAPGSVSGKDTDLNNDGTVDDFDLFTLTQHFLEGC